MAKLEEIFSGKIPLYALISLLAGSNGANFLSEGSEDVEREELTEKIAQADYIQDVKADALLALVNEMRIELALNSQALEALQ